MPDIPKFRVPRGEEGSNKAGAAPRDVKDMAWTQHQQEPGRDLPSKKVGIMVVLLFGCIAGMFLFKGRKIKPTTLLDTAKQATEGHEATLPPNAFPSSKPQRGWSMVDESGKPVAAAPAETW